MSNVNTLDTVWLVYLENQVIKAFTTESLAQDFVWCLQEKREMLTDLYYEPMKLEYK